MSEEIAFGTLLTILGVADLEFEVETALPTAMPEEKAVQQLYEFVTAQDERVCPICEALDGNQYTMDEVTAEFPNALTGTDPIFPNIHANCRCILISTEERQSEV